MRRHVRSWRKPTPRSQGASVGQPTEPCLVVVGRLRMVLLRDLPLQVVVDGVAARQVHAVWSGLDPWRVSCRPQMSQRVPVGGGSLLMVCMVSVLLTSIASSFHGRRESTGESETIAQVIVSCHRGIWRLLLPVTKSRAHRPGESHFCQRRTSLKRLQAVLGLMPQALHARSKLSCRGIIGPEQYQLHGYDPVRAATGAIGALAMP